jgi:hypothetical protein
MHLPSLKKGKCYRHEEIAQYLVKHENGSDDFLRARLHYEPPDMLRRELWLTEGHVVEYREIPRSILEEQVDELETQFERYPGHFERIQTILHLLRAGAVALPVIIPDYDPKRRILEGMHRVIAFRLAGLELVPTFLLRIPSLEPDSALWPRQIP